MADVEIIRIDKGEVGGFFVENAPGDEPPYLAEMTFYWRDRTMVITHTVVREQLAGLGVGLRLLNTAIEAARTEGFSIIPVCPYARRQFNKHPEWNDVKP